MKNNLDKITIRLTNGYESELRVEEFCPYEPSAYCLDAGWTCFSVGGIEYFVSTDGNVYKQPENDFVGIAPEIKAAADKMEAQMTEAYDNA